ncbi:Caleosin related protein-domain-containing protein [Lasiosphaeria hispida]|uniref:Caleosin related protein-domain-containing protein n=1 Tax=Lasiosphaeria hispida TaxID=260671 RepID=A0AAJ0HAZ6_9PEZI|nr:Caleosin related protein-domain-containing protein [Lasiosphaeria hispida]
MNVDDEREIITSNPRSPNNYHPEYLPTHPMKHTEYHMQSHRQTETMPHRPSPSRGLPPAQADDKVDFALAVPHCPETSQRPQAVDAEESISRPSIARANIAVSTEHPAGSHNRQLSFAKNKEYTVLQQHVLFWDRDMDGAIYPLDTYRGFRDLGFSILFSLLSMFIINVNFSYPTRLALGGYLPDPLFRVYVGGVHKAKHGSDSGTYDHEGRFVPQAFEDMFSKWDADRKGALSFVELWRMIAGNRLVVDPFGWFAAIFEFGSTWLLLQKDGMVSKEDLRRTYDGSIFWHIREQRLRGKGWDKGFGLGNVFDAAVCYATGSKQKWDELSKKSRREVRQRGSEGSLYSL